MVQVGDSVPNIDLVEGNPGNKVNLSKELGSGLIVGVPAAFSKCPTPPCFYTGASPTPSSKNGLLKVSSFPAPVVEAPTELFYGYNDPPNTITGPTCSDSHIPGYIANPNLKDAGKVFVVSVNDAFV
jgi:peroxiredoxin 5